MVYPSASPELALLETLVHLDGTPLSNLPPYVLVTLALPEGAVEVIAEEELLAGWQELPSPEHVARFLLPRLQPGNPFLAFAAPSSILPGFPTRNVLLTPLRPLIAQVRLLAVTPLGVDERRRPEPVVPVLAEQAGRVPAKRKRKSWCGFGVDVRDTFVEAG